MTESSPHAVSVVPGAAITLADAAAASSLSACSPTAFNAALSAPETEFAVSEPKPESEPNPEPPCRLRLSDEDTAVGAADVAIAGAAPLPACLVPPAVAAAAVGVAGCRLKSRVRETTTSLVSRTERLPRSSRSPAAISAAISLRASVHACAQCRQRQCTQLKAQIARWQGWCDACMVDTAFYQITQQKEGRNRGSNVWEGKIFAYASALDPPVCLLARLLERSLEPVAKQH